MNKINQSRDIKSGTKLCGKSTTKTKMSSLQADGKRDENLVVDSTQTQTGTKSKQDARYDLIKSLPKLSTNLNNVTLSENVSIDDNLKGRKPS